MLHVALSLIDVREVCGIVQRDPLDLFNVVKEGLHRHVLSLVLYSVDQKGGDLDSVQFGYARPVAKRAGCV